MCIALPHILDEESFGLPSSSFLPNNNFITVNSARLTSVTQQKTMQSLISPTLAMSPPNRQNNASKFPSEADLITNRALLNYAEASRLAKSWLSGFPSATGNDDQETDQEREAEEEAERTLLKNRDSYSDTGGIGYHALPDSDGSAFGTRPAVTDPTTTFLRKQLLGGRGASRVGVISQRHNVTATRPRHQHVRQQGKEEVNSDEEESRAAVGKKRGHTSGQAAKTAPHSALAEDTHSNAASATNAPSRAEDVLCDLESTADSILPSSTAATKPRANNKRGTSSYLDELLATRAAKKQKKNKGKSKPD